MFERKILQSVLDALSACTETCSFFSFPTPSWVVGRLRKKLDGSRVRIETLRGVGYRLTAQ